MKDCCTDGRGVDLFFSGTDTDWEDLKEIVRRMDVKQQICCCDGGGRMISSEAVLEKIDEIFKGVAEDFADDSKIKADLDKYLDASRSGVVLVVAGAYSAGKSSFINALIGEELLPTASSPTTAKIFKVTSLPRGTWSDTVIRFQYGDQSVQICFNQDGYYLEDSAFLPELELAVPGHCASRCKALSRVCLPADLGIKRIQQPEKRRCRPFDLRLDRD